jgi:hypothetical protein
MKPSQCPHCHQPIRQERAGVHLGPVKVHIFDALKAAGDIGVSAEELIHQLAHEGMGAKSRHTIKAHIYQLNELLAGTDCRVASDGRRPWRWHLTRAA